MIVYKINDFDFDFDFLDFLDIVLVIDFDLDFDFLDLDFLDLFFFVFLEEDKDVEDEDKEDVGSVDVVIFISPFRSLASFNACLKEYLLSFFFPSSKIFLTNKFHAVGAILYIQERNKKE